MKIRKNEDTELVAEVQRQLKENDNYCPCRLARSADTKCMCKFFRDAVKRAKETNSTDRIECDCGLWVYDN